MHMENQRKPFQESKLRGKNSSGRAVGFDGDSEVQRYAGDPCAQRPPPKGHRERLDEARDRKWAHPPARSEVCGSGGVCLARAPGEGEGVTLGLPIRRSSQSQVGQSLEVMVAGFHETNAEKDRTGPRLVLHGGEVSRDHGLRPRVREVYTDSCIQAQEYATSWEVLQKVRKRTVFCESLLQHSSCDIYSKVGVEMGNGLLGLIELHSGF